MAYGIDNISVDIMFGLPTQSLKDVIDTLSTVVTWPIKHVSLYDLTIEKHSYFGRNNIKKVNVDLCDEMYFTAIDFLEKTGFKQYEISNFANDGYQSTHNIVYWQYQDFYGVGLNASGKLGHMWYTNTTNFIDYLDGQYIADKVVNDLKQYLFEKLMMGLRLKNGIQLNDDEINRIINFYDDVFKNMIDNDLIILDNHTLKATAKGYPILNDILLDLLPI